MSRSPLRKISVTWRDKGRVALIESTPKYSIGTKDGVEYIYHPTRYYPNAHIMDSLDFINESLRLCNRLRPVDVFADRLIEEATHE